MAAEAHVIGLAEASEAALQDPTTTVPDKFRTACEEQAISVATEGMEEPVATRHVDEPEVPADDCSSSSSGSITKSSEDYSAIKARVKGLAETGPVDIEPAQASEDRHRRPVAPSLFPSEPLTLCGYRE